MSMSEKTNFIIISTDRSSLSRSQLHDRVLFQRALENEAKSQFYTLYPNEPGNLVATRISVLSFFLNQIFNIIFYISFKSDGIIIYLKKKKIFSSL